MKQLQTSPWTIAELVLSAGLSALLTMAYIIYVGRILGPAEYADFAAGLSVIYFVGLALSPLTPAISRLCARSVARGERHGIGALRRRITLRVMAGGLVTALAFVACAPFLAPAFKFRSPLSLILAFLVAVFFAQISVDRGVIHGLLLFRVHNTNTVLEALLRGLLAAVLFAGSRTAVSALAAYLVASVVAELMLAVALRSEWSSGEVTVDGRELRSVFLPIALLMLGLTVFQNSDMLIVKRFFAAGASGAYGAATALARGVGILFVPLYVVVSPILSGRHESRQPLFGLTLAFAGGFLALVAVPLAILAAGSQRIVTILYGPAFQAAAALLLPLAGVAVLMYTTLMLSQTLITIADHSFLGIYGVIALVQIAALIRFHETFGDVLRVLYACEIAAFVVVAMFFIVAWKREGQPAK